MSDTPRPADPLTRIAALATELDDGLVSRSEAADIIRATLDATRAPRSVDVDETRDAQHDEEVEWAAPRSDDALAYRTGYSEGLNAKLDTLPVRSDDALRAALEAMVKASEGVQWKIGGEHKGPGEAFLDAVINARNLLATPAAPPLEEPMRFSDEGTYLDPKYTKGET